MRYSNTDFRNTNCKAVNIIKTTGEDIITSIIAVNRHRVVSRVQIEFKELLDLLVGDILIIFTKHIKKNT